MVDYFFIICVTSVPTYNELMGSNHQTTNLVFPNFLHDFFLSLSQGRDQWSDMLTLSQSGGVDYAQLLVLPHHN